jgi:hypothetical protein
LPDGEAYGLRIRFPRRLGHHTLVVEAKICTTPKAQSHASTDPERVCHIFLTITVDAGFTSDVVICVGRESECVREIVAHMLFQSKDRILRKRLRSVHAKIIIVGEQ